MLEQVDKQLAAELRSHLDKVEQTVSELGPIADLWQQANSIFQHSFPNVRAAIDAGKRIREQILKLLDQPKCQYDDCALQLSTLLLTIPNEHRQAVRKMIALKERTALSPYVSRADWLSLEEKSETRLLSGLVIQALILPDHQDLGEISAALAPAHVCAQELHLDLNAIFNQASTFAGPGTDTALREFANKKGVTLEAFGILKAMTPTGIRFRQSDD